MTAAGSFSEAFWVVVGTAAPVLALAFTVAITQVLAASYRAGRVEALHGRISARPTLFWTWLSLGICVGGFALCILLLHWSLRSLLDERDAVSSGTVLTLVTVTIGMALWLSLSLHMASLTAGKHLPEQRLSG